MIIHVKTNEEFESEIKNFDCFVDFFATWCGPCKMLTPVIEELDEKGSFNDMHILKVDVDELRDIAIKFSIQAVPTLMIFRKGNLEKTAMGYMNEADLLNFIK